MLDPRQLEQPLTEKEQILRDHFVSQYLKDFDAYNACLRLGFQPTYANTWADVLLKDGYVQRKLQYLSTEPEGPEQEMLDKLMSKRELRRVAQRGSDSARVAAIRQLDSMYGWTKVDDAAPPEDLIAAYRQIATELPA